MKQKKSLPTLEFGELMKIGGNSLLTAGMFLLDNINEEKPTYSNSIMAKMMVKIRLDILTICRQGYVDYIIDNNEPVRLEPGKIAYFQQDQIIEFNADPNVKLLLIAFPHSLAHSIPELDSTGIAYDSTCYTPSEGIVTKLVSIYSLIRSVAECPDINYQRETILSLMRSLLFCLANAVTESEAEADLMGNSNAPRRSKKIYNDFSQLVKTHFRSHRDVRFYADKLCITPGHLSRVVKEISEQSVSHWIRNYITLEAKYMLKSSDAPISEISEHLNFPNPSFFSKYFRQTCGLTPGQFREYGAYSGNFIS